MGLLDFFTKRQKLSTVLPQIPFNGQVAIQQGIITWQGGDNISFVRDGYSANDIVYSIVKLITDKAKLAPFHVYKVVDEVSAKKYKALISQPDKIENWKDVQNLHKKAFELYTGDARLNELLKYPNPYEMFVLPSQYMYVLANIQNFPPTIAGYQLNYGPLWNFTKQEILQDKYFNPQWNTTGNQLYGQSPLMAAARNLTRSNEAKTAAVASFQNGGPAGVLFMNDERFDPISGTQQAQALKRAVSEKSGSANFNSIAVSGYKVDWKQIGLSPVELDIIESEKWDMKALCNIYGVPSQLLNDADNKTYNNQREGEKALTVRCAIPLLVGIRDNLNRKLHSDWGYRNTDIYVDFDPTVYSELEANKAEQVEWLDKAWWIAPKQKMDIMGLEIPPFIDQTEMEKLYIPSSLQAPDEFQPLTLPNE